MTPSPLHVLAAALNGTVHEDRITVGAAVIYVGITGKVRVQQPGRPVADLGTWQTPTDELAAAFVAACGVTA